jgi:hypothetical protein
MFHVEQLLSIWRSAGIRHHDILLDRGVFHVEHQGTKDIVWTRSMKRPMFHVEHPAAEALAVRP